MAEKRKKMKSFMHIGDILSDSLNRYRKAPESGGGGLVKIWDIWDDAVGVAIAENAKPAAFKGDLLIVHSVSSTWIHQLQFLKADIIRKVNAALGETAVRDIRFKVGPL